LIAPNRTQSISLSKWEKRGILINVIGFGSKSPLHPM
jgi:hypothetical protein